MRRRSVINLAKINDKLQWGGKLTRSEGDEIRARLKEPRPNEDIYALALALSRGVRPFRNNVVLLERLMHADIDDFDLSGVLMGLCLHWKRAHRHKDFLLNVCHQNRFIRNFESAKVAFSIFEKNHNKPNFISAFEVLYWRWQETLKPQEKPINAEYSKCLNRLMEALIYGDKVFDPLYNRIGKMPPIEWDDQIGEILAERKARYEKNKFKFGIFDKIFASA